MMMKGNSKVDTYVRQLKQWREETEQLRKIILDCGLTEELKWRQPCYTFQGGNVVIIQGFKAYCALLFFKGALMKDINGSLVKTGENTQAGRQIRFAGVQEITGMETILKRYIRDAVRVEKAGLKVEFKDTKDFPIPDEFKAKLDENPALRKAFAALTPGRQRAYLLHFSGAKQSSTRTSRVEKCMSKTLSGKGLND